MEFLSTFFYEAMIRISSTFLFDATGEVLERMLKEEREIYLENNPFTKGNGFYERDSRQRLANLQLYVCQEQGIMDLKVPFYSILPRRNIFTCY
ncbi:hypothetical protein KDW03_00635 [Thermospira aquatica]|uniref:Transposase DDE domain-containing protein n=1 Tax=Thermospira aquatica TaxID=2828656 RepID=A0AAX3BE69_9SPIR|nr:hypothetical protein [Thermospira aquatica]URA10344.1 hypothetical protein KDW03_00635 [Thermospira aquatica]